MPQNLVSLAFQPGEADALRDTIRGVIAQLQPRTVTLDADDRRELLKMGGKSEIFCRRVIDTLALHRDLVPPSLPLDEALRDRDALDALRPLLEGLEQLVSLLRDTEMALRSDLMVFAVDGYALLKVLGGQQGLDTQLKELATRFQRGSRKGPSAPSV